MMIIISILIAVVFLGILIFIHEWTHFIIARKGGVKVLVFSIGFGPSIFEWKRGDTLYKLSVFPLGGYVRLYGQEPGEIKGEPDEFYSKPAWIRVLVVLGGPFSNLIAGFLIYLFVIGIIGVEAPGTTFVKPDTTSLFQKFDKIVVMNGIEVKDWYDVMDNLKDTNTIVVMRQGRPETILIDKETFVNTVSPVFPPIIGGVERGGPADKAGLAKGDSIIEIGGKRIKTWEDMRNIIMASPGESLKVVWKAANDGVREGIVIPEETKTLQGDSTVTVGIIGIVSPVRIRRVDPITTVKMAWIQFEDTALKIFRVFGLLVKRKVSPRELGGPIAIVYLTGRSISWGWKNLFYFIAFISINLGVVNLIPIPPLDGAHALLGAIEMITRKKPGEKSLKVLENIGFFFFIFLFLFVTFNDILRFLHR